jgi:diguanylate cyclase (GGDEF)-like protein
METVRMRICLGAWIAALTAAFYALPQFHIYMWAAVNLSAALIVLVGVRIHRPSHRLPWFLLSAGIASFTGGDTASDVLTNAHPFPSVADLFCLIAYPLVAAALLIFIRLRSGMGSRAALLDALVPTAGLGLLFWVFRIAPYVRDGHLSLIEKLYPLGDVLVLAVLARLLTMGGRRPVALRLVAVGVTGLLVADVLYGLGQPAGTGSLADAGWILFYAATAFAALHSSMREMTARDNADSEVAGAGRIAVMSLTAMIAPAVLLVEDLRGNVVHAPMIAIASSGIFLLVMARVAGLIQAQRETVARERLLRISSADLVGATTDVEAATAMRNALSSLVPSGRPYVFHVYDEQAVLPATTAVVPPRWVRVADLPPEVASELAPYEAALWGGLVVSGRRKFGCLAGNEDLLHLAEHCFHTLMMHGIMAVERIATTDEVTRRLERDLAHEMKHDALTGLPNRSQFQSRLQQAAGIGCRTAVLFVDLDDFEEVNSLGHAAGDQLLITVGRKIAEVAGPGNVVARTGSDEFAVLIEHVLDVKEPEIIAERIVSTLSTPFEVSDDADRTHVVSGTASVGIATSTEAGGISELLRRAGLAMSMAKTEGKNTWQKYQDELGKAMARRMQLRAALNEAVPGNQMRLRLQPIVDLPTAEVVGMEALVRWEHPRRGLLGPGEFIELSEESGAVVAIGAWVLREALRVFTGWQRTRPANQLGYVSVNVSARQFRAPGFAGQVRAVLDETGARPEWLLLEITESMVMHDAGMVWRELGELRSMGVRIAIDDFGTGYSSLSYLCRMPVDVLKIDKSFIDDILPNPQQMALVETIVSLARTLDLIVVAEGIELEEHREALVAMGCPYGQGYLFSKPVTPQEFLLGTRGKP